MGTTSGMVDLTGLVLVGDEVVFTAQILSEEDKCANITEDELAKVAKENLAAVGIKTWDVMLFGDKVSKEEQDEYSERIRDLPRLYFQFSAREIPNSTALVCWIKLSLIHYLAAPTNLDAAAKVNGATWESERVIVVEKVDSRDEILKTTKQILDHFAEDQAMVMRSYLSQ